MLRSCRLCTCLIYFLSSVEITGLSFVNQGTLRALIQHGITNDEYWIPKLLELIPQGVVPIQTLLLKQDKTDPHLKLALSKLLTRTFARSATVSQTSRPLGIL